MNIFKTNAEKYKTSIVELSKHLSKLSTLRLIAFLFSITIILILANQRLAALLLVITPLCVVGFGILVNKYNRAAYLKKHASFLQEINEQEILKQHNKLSDFPTGQNFINQKHPYVADFDIFGPNSLFQLINRTTTESGNEQLAEWLAAPVAKDIILERQQAIEELAPKLEWRQQFQASGMHFSNSRSDYNKLLTWIEKPVELLPHQTKYLLLSIPLAILATASVAYFFNELFSTPSNWLVALLCLGIVLFVNARILKTVSHLSEEIIDQTNQNVRVLGGYQALITSIESENFQSPTLARLQSAFRQDNYSAANEINHLKNIFDMFKLRGTKSGGSMGRNEFYSIFNKLWLLDIYLILQTEKWKIKNSPSLRGWASAVSEFEVLSSVAGFAFANPSFTFPQIKEEPYVIHFETLGHPLISPQQRVCNDFHLEGKGEAVIITGSNMAGKSTFLRTLGVNMVLAGMGAPCCATSGSVSNMRLFSSMRTQDNLEEGVSSFYAELKRIEQLLDLIKSGQAIFFLLDEMFKGTNSKDRYKGGVSLIKQLSELNAFGVISTHDLELAKLSGNHLHVANYSFNSEIVQGELLFNYKLTEGICRDFNASELMKKSGIQILDDIELIG